MGIDFRVYWSSSGFELNGVLRISSIFATIRSNDVNISWNGLLLDMGGRCWSCLGKESWCMSTFSLGELESLLMWSLVDESWMFSSIVMVFPER